MKNEQNNRSKAVLFGVLLLSGLAGCGAQAPDCAALEVQEVVLDIAKERLVGMAFVNVRDVDKLVLSLESIRTIATDSSTGAHQCAAVLKVGGGWEFPLTYSSENTSQAGEFYVTVH